jgi:trans-aconitate methyltransferase
MLTMSLGVHRWMHRTAEAAPFSHEGGKESTVQRFRSELDLTPAQTEQLELILDDYFTYYATVQAQLDDVRASGKHKLLRLLNDDQKRRFERLMAELQEKQKLR